MIMHILTISAETFEQQQQYDAAIIDMMNSMKENIARREDTSKTPLVFKPTLKINLLIVSEKCAKTSLLNFSTPLTLYFGTDIKITVFFIFFKMYNCNKTRKTI